MARPGRAGIGWLQRLLRGAGGTSVAPDALRCLPVEEAVAALELRYCDVRVRRLDGAPSAALAALLDASVPEVRNALGRVPQALDAAGATETLRLAIGTTLAGLRTSLTLSQSELVEVHADLRSAAERLLPLVVQVAADRAGQAGLDAVADSGWFQLVAQDGQEALDLTLLARWLAERALRPGLVCHDGPDLDSFAWPDDAALLATIGAPEEPIPASAEAQRLLFGETRPRLLPWLDVDRPVATGGPRDARTALDAELGRRRVFEPALWALAEEGMQTLSRALGRPLGFAREDGLEDAEVVLVASGRAAVVARAVAAALRRERGGVRIGVIAPSWLRPFPAEAVARGLAGRKAVAVLETQASSGAGAPLFAELARACPDARSLVSLACGSRGPEPAALAALARRLRRPAELPRRIELEGLAITLPTGFPRRDALLQATLHAYPELAGEDPPQPQAEPTPPREAPGVASLGLLADESALPADLVERLTTLLRKQVGPHVRGWLERPRPGLCALRLHAAAEPVPAPGPRAPVALAWLMGSVDRAGSDAVDALASGGWLLLGAAGSDAQLLAAWPPALRERARRQGVRVLRVSPDPERVLQALPAWLAAEPGPGGEEDAEAPRELDLSGAGEPGAGEPAPPSLVSRIPRARPAHDSLPRFYGELLQPLQAGAAGPLVDPLAVAGAVPSYASALAPGVPLAPLPELDAARCSGCGRCWSVCPDSAIGGSVLPPESLLTAASRLGGREGRVADAVRRAHKHLAARLASELARGGGVLSAGACREAWSALEGRLSLAEDERDEHAETLGATAEVVEGLRPMATAKLFVEREQRAKGQGGLLVLGFDPRACLGCGICAAECPESAIVMAERSEDRRSEAARHYAAWEALPDTSGALLGALEQECALDGLAARLLSRHSALAQVGSGEGEPGSGERLALRLVAALAEAQLQPRLARWAESIATARRELEAAARARLGEGLARADLQTLHEALDGAGARSDLARVGERLEALGTRADVDRPALLRMLRLAETLQRRERMLLEGEDGLGRARFAVVVAGERLAGELARFPLHPFHAPLTVAAPAAAAELARGAAIGLVAAHVAAVRELRAARVLMESPPDRSERLEAIAALGWSDLDADERAGCPPLLLVIDDQSWLDRGLEPLSRLFACDWPVKLVLLDGRGRLDPAPEPALQALLQRRAFVLSASIAHPDHLVSGLRDALASAGPALVQLHAPSPARHGFAPDATLEIARRAVESRAHWLLRYDPAAAGSFGEKIDLAGNPLPEDENGEVEFAAWAGMQARFASHFDSAGQPDARISAAGTLQLSVWRTLQELAGLRSPFVERLRGRLARELEADFGERTRQLEAAHREALAAAQAEVEEAVIERVTERLLLLSQSGAATGIGEAGRGAAGGEGEA